MDDPGQFRGGEALLADLLNLSPRPIEHECRQMREAGVTHAQVRRIVRAANHRTVSYTSLIVGILIGTYSIAVYFLSDPQHALTLIESWQVPRYEVTVATLAWVLALCGAVSMGYQSARDRLLANAVRCPELAQISALLSGCGSRRALCGGRQAGGRPQ
jgi:hypothetical protein